MEPVIWWARPAHKLKAYERRLLEGDWQSVSCEVEVQLIAEDNKETYVLARSRARAQKESAMRSRVVRGLMRDLIRLRRLLRHGRLKDPAKALLHLGRLKERYRQAWQYVKISIQDLCLSWRWDRDALRLAASRDGAYLLRTSLEGSDPVRLSNNTFSLQKSKPFSARSKATWPSGRSGTSRQAGGSPRHGRLPGILSVGVPQAQTQSQRTFIDPHGNCSTNLPAFKWWKSYKLRAGGCICLERVTQPEAAQAALIHQLDWPLPQQPPPKIYRPRSKMCKSMTPAGGIQRTNLPNVKKMRKLG